MIPKTVEPTALVRRGDVPLTYRAPLLEMEELRRNVDDMFHRFFGYTPTLPGLIPVEPTAFEPPVDIYETTEEIICFVTLPGFTPTDIEVNVNPEVITLVGERKPFAVIPEEARVYRRSGLFTVGHFTWTYTLPVPINPELVKAVFKNGVLELRLPKMEVVKPTNVKIEVTPV
jgi:HSP20 family protein